MAGAQGSSFGAMVIALDTEEGREFLQRRLSAFGRVTSFISAFFLVGGTVLSVALVPDYTLKDALLVPWAGWHVGALAGSVLLWLTLRSGSPSARAIVFWDATANVAICSCYGAMAHYSILTGNTRPDLLMMLVLMSILVLRSVLVPSSWRQTLLVTTLCWIPALVLSVFIGSALESTIAVAYVFAPVNVFLWGSVIVAIATLASKVIYGLRQEVAKAQRLGQYELVSKIGQGGMGEVYRARHALLRRPTAVKLLLPERSGQAALARFEREVRLTAKLTHPNTVAIFDYGHTPEGLFYYAMELLDGVDLEQLVAQDGAQPESRVVHILTQVCGSLSEAHGIGLVHRDIKPANIVLCERGGVLDTAKVVDFGLVKESDAAASPGDEKLSMVNTLIGTPLYMAPETIKRPEAAGPSSDLYALGAVGYFLLTGATVFSAETAMEVCAAHLHEQPERPSTRLGTPLNAALEDLLLSCLEKDADKRPRSAAAMRQSLLHCGVEPWSEAQARAWWSARPKRDTPVESSSPKNALTVNFADRMDPITPK